MGGPGIHQEWQQGELNLGEHACEFKTGGGPWSWN